ncbi:hypothetical protein GCM10009647_019240 [Streptomyces sanglieri]
MRTRNILAGLALGTAITLGGVAAPAQAVTAPSTAAANTKSPVEAQRASAVGHFYSSHRTAQACYDAASYWIGQHPSWWATCKQFPGTDGVMKWHLYMWY